MVNLRFILESTLFGVNIHEFSQKPYYFLKDGKVFLGINIMFIAGRQEDWNKSLV